MTQSVQDESARAGTKTRILDAAERLFANHGFSATSLRQITTEARANLAAVNYHFQSKDSLIEAVLVRKIGPINRRRLELLDALEGSGLPLTTPAVLRAFVQPLFEAEQQGVDTASFPRLLARIYSDEQESLLPLFRTTFREVIQRFGVAFQTALPGLDGRDFALGLHFCIGSMAHLFAARRVLEMLVGDSRQFGKEEAMEGLIAFCGAGMKAMHEGRAGR